MTSHHASDAVSDGSAARPPTGLGRQVMAGLVVFGVLSLFDVVFTFVPAGPGEVGPPLPVVVLGLLLGVLSLVLIALVPRFGRRALIWLVGCRLLSALIGLPAFVVDGVPGWVRVLVAVFGVLTLVACVLVRPGLARRAHLSEGAA
jgi:hypothetical protein